MLGKRALERRMRALEEASGDGGDGRALGGSNLERFLRRRHPERLAELKTWLAKDLSRSTCGWLEDGGSELRDPFAEWLGDVLVIERHLGRVDAQFAIVDDVLGGVGTRTERCRLARLWRQGVVLASCWKPPNSRHSGLITT